MVLGNGWIDARSRPWVFRNGTLTLLPVAPSQSVGASAINEVGDIVGAAADGTTGHYHPLRWPAARPGTVETLDVPRTDARPVGITPDGTSSAMPATSRSGRHGSADPTAGWPT